MNCIYRIVWSQVSNTWVAVAENARGRCKSTTGPRLVAAALALAGFSLGMPSAYAASAADATVSAGSGHVSTVGNTTTINQASQRLAIDWTSLSTRANEALVFAQSNAQAIALNRITGSSPSELLGSLTANGQVFILNPNGVLFGAGSQVNVGGLVASTLSMSNADFMAGNHVFSNNGTSGSVINQGALNAAPGGYLALLAPEVRNEGVMTASLGTALLAAGNKVTLNLDNGSLLGYSIDQGAINALADNKQLIQANGGQVLLSARAMDSLTTATVNNTGVIEAKTMQNKAGRILLMGDMELGTVNVAGTLDASAPNGGDGGFVETSAAHVNVAGGAYITTRAQAGKTGQWLIDPFDFVVASTGGNITGATLSSQLDNNNVTLTTTSGNTGTNGDLSINDAVAWSAANTLTLIGERDVNVSANLTYSGSGTAGVTVQAVRDINVGANAAITSSGAGALPVVFGGPVTGEAAGGVINMGSGSSIVTTGGDVTFNANAIKLAGASVTAAGGNIAMTAAGTSASHSLEITDVGGTRSNVTTTGAGTITLSGSLTDGGASATGGSASGVVVTNSSITSDTGAISITGHAGGASTGGQIERGFRLDSGTQITSAGDISLTGTVTGNQPIPAPQYDPYISGPPSVGGEVLNGTTVSSTGGNVTLSGTFTNRAHYNGTGLAVDGKVQSGAGNKVTLTGAAVVGSYAVGTRCDGITCYLASTNGLGTGLSTGLLSEVVAGTGGLDITGTVSASGGSITLTGVSLAGAASSTGNIAVTGTLSAPSAIGPQGINLQGGTLTGLGAATITLRGSGVPSPAPASYHDVNVYGTAVSTAGGQISLIGNRVRIDSTINSGSGRTVIAPTTTWRDITIDGAPGSEQSGLNLSYSELNLITAGVLQLGGGAYTGDISIGNTGFSTVALMTSTPALSLLTTGNISQGAGSITVSKLNAVGASVTLTAAGNQIDEISGRSTSGAFQVTSSKAAPLTVGTVDGMVGINSGANATVLTNLNGAIAQTQAIIAGSFTGSSMGGINLNLAANQIGAFTASNSGLGDIVLRNGINTTLTSLVNTGAGRIDVDNIGTVTLASSAITSDGTAAGTTSGSAAVSVKGSQGIVASGAAPHISNSAGGSVYLDGGAGSVGASSASAIGVSAASVSAQAASGASEVNLILAGGGTLENIAAVGSVNVAAATGSLAVKTVSGSSVTLSAAAGAITDANGASNNITASTLNVSSRDGIALTTNVSGLQTLATTGTTGDINITAANAINTGNFSISTDAASVQTVSLGSGAGITVGSAFGNSQDKLKLIATGGNIAVNGVLTASELTLSTGGTSSQTAAITATGLELLGSGTHTLNHASNAVTTLAGNTGNVDYSQAGALAIGTVNTAGLTASGKVLVRATGAAGDITLNNAVTSGSAANDSLVLAAGRNFINNAGATPLNPGAGRFLVYSTDPTANTFGGFASTGNAFSRSYAANAPVDASMTSLSGNRMVYSITPVLNVSGNNQSKVYGATDPTLTYTLNSGLVAGDTAGSALAGLLAAPTGSSASAGTHAITQGTLAAALGYGIAYTNGTLTVDKATLTVTGLAADNKTYNGSAAATLSNIGNLAGLVNGEALTLSSTGASFADANAGTGKTVTATYSLANGAGGLASNYQLAAAPVTTTADIGKATVTVTGVVANNKTYDGNATATLSNIGALSGLVSGEALALSQTGATFSDKNAANGKTVTVTGYSLADGAGGLASNYQLASAPVTTTANLDKATVTVTGVVADNKTYDRNATATLSNAGTLSGLVGGEALTLSATGASFADKNAGTGKTVTVAYSLANGAGGLASNYQLAAPVTATADITQLGVTVTATTANKTYDGTTASSTTLAGSGVLVGDTVSFNGSALFADKNVGTGKTVSITGISAGGVDGGNYNLLNTTAGSTADITKANLSVTANNDSRIVGSGAAYAGGNGVNYNGFAPGETAAVLGGALAYGGNSQGASAAGSYAITPGGYSATNYTLTYVDGVLSIRQPSAAAAALGGLALTTAYDSALQVVAGIGGSQGGGGGNGGARGDASALAAAAAEAGNTGEDE